MWASRMKRAFLIGKKLYLRPLEESDVSDEYLQWLNDPEVTRYLEAGRFPATPASVRRYLERFQNPANELIFAIVDIESKQHIGNVTLNHIDWVNRKADTGILIGRKDFWGKGYAFEAWSLVIEYAFQGLGLRKITAGAVAENVDSLSVLKRLGFQMEGVRRKEYFLDGEYLDVPLMGLFRDEFYKFTN